jgi:transposase
MKYTQNEKILQITDQTLVIGMDIASETQYGRAFDNRGIELGNLLKFSNDIEGFGHMVFWVKELKQEYQKQQVIVGMEPTGHYWFALAQYLKDHDIKVVLVNPFHVKRSKELDDNNPTKNDRKDPKTIAMLAVVYDLAYSPETVDTTEFWSWKLSNSIFGKAQLVI